MPGPRVIQVKLRPSSSSVICQRGRRPAGFDGTWQITDDERKVRLRLPKPRRSKDERISGSSGFKLLMHYARNTRLYMQRCAVCMRGAQSTNLQRGFLRPARPPAREHSRQHDCGSPSGCDGGADGRQRPGQERSLEYDTGVTLTKDPDGRMTYGGSSGGAMALRMAWYRTERYHRILSYSGTFVESARGP